MLKQHSHQRNIVILVLVLSALLFFLAQTKQGSAVQNRQLVNLDGGKLSLLEDDKKLSWINFWSISCPPCLQELPELQTAHQKYKQSNDVRILTIAMHYDPPNLVKDVQSRLKLTLPIGLDLDGTVAAHFAKDMVVPSHYLVNANGSILYSHIGPLNSEQLEQQLYNFL